MVADMLAAGNRVIVKASELSPTTSELLRKEVSKHFSDDVLATVIGGIEFSQYFSTLK
jgi:coniferyl-aldehyde dehydrogenase